MTRGWILSLAFGALLAGATPARPTAVQLTSGNTSLLFGGTDAEGGIGDWYLSNGVVEAVIDNAGIATDLTPLVPGSEPALQSEASPTGGTIIDLGRVGLNDDQLSQMFTVGGLSTSNFILYDTVTAPTSDTIRATGQLLLPPISVSPSPCIDIVTDHTASGSDPFLTISTTATNNCGVNVNILSGFLDAFVWTQRSIIPFSSGGFPPTGGRGFNHPVLDLSNPAASLEFPTFLAGPGIVKPADGLIDTINNTTSGEVSYGLLGVDATFDQDGPGGSAPVTSAVNGFFGVSSNLASALGNFPVSIPPPGLMPGGTLTYRRRLYVGTRNDVRSVADDILTELATRLGFSTGTISGTVTTADTGPTESSILITRVGRCTGNPSITCKTNAACTGGSGPCADPVAAPGFAINQAVDQVRTDATGVVSGVVLPAGSYELVVSSPERSDVVVSPVVVTAATDTPVTIPALSARGTVVFTVREKIRSMPLLPAKLTFKGVTPTADPRFHRDLAANLGTSDLQPETFGGTQPGTSGHAAGQGNVVYTATGTGDIQVRPGTYDVYASRGLEYSVQLKRLVVPSGGTVTADFQIKHSVRTTNAVSADFHVHSGRSFDASAPLRDRVAAFAGEGVEVMVSTDHDKNTDYAPIITAFGIGARLRSIIGDELTGSVPNPPAFPQSFGHINAWPLTVSVDEKRDGAIEDEFVAPNWLYKRLRDHGAAVIQYNHPRAGVSGLTSIGFFNNIGCNRCANSIDTPCAVDADCPSSPAPQDCTCVGYQPDRPIAMAPNDILLDTGVLGPGSPANPDLDPDTGNPIRNLDFDVMEIENGAKDSDFPQLRQVRRDWLSLLNQGIFRPGTAVSDSHRITVEHAGWSRSFVRGVGDDPAALDVNAFDAQVKGGSMVMSSGPYIEFTMRKAAGGPKTQIGGTLVGPPGGQVLLDVKVLSPAWIPVPEVRVLKNGFVVATYNGGSSPRVAPVPVDFQKTGRTRRFRGRIVMNVAQDAYFLIEAGPVLPPSINTLPTPPPIVDIIEPDVIPMAITNPIFVDLAGDGFDAPGLPVMAASNPLAERPVYAGPDRRPLWSKLWTGVMSFASRLTGDVVAEEKPGEMTGVTKQQKAEAVQKGEYFPLHEFKIPPEVVEQLRREREAAQPPAAQEPAPAQ